MPLDGHSKEWWMARADAEPNTSFECGGFPPNQPSILGPGDPQALLDIMTQSVMDCQVKGCVHCRAIGYALGRYNGPRLEALGSGYAACARHGTVREDHTCSWGQVVKLVERD